MSLGPHETLIAPSVRVYVASLNTAAATELCIRSLRDVAGYPFALTLGDSGSTDGSLPMLRRFETLGWLSLEVAPAPRQHAEWLDRWLGSCVEDYAVFVDSDVEFRRAGCLRSLVDTAVAEQAALVAAEMLPEIAEYVVPPALGAVARAQVPNFAMPPGRRVVRLVARPAPWLLLVKAVEVAALSTSFGVHLEDEGSVDMMGFDVGGRVFRDIRAAGLRWVAMPASYQAMYHHYGGLSWLPLKGRRGLRKRRDLVTVHRRLRRLRRSGGEGRLGPPPETAR